MAKHASFWIAVALSGILLLVVPSFVWFVSDNYTVTTELASMAKPPAEPIRVRYLEQYIELFRIIVVGVVVALASVLIPLVYSQAKAKFERYKEARSAYSRAKTAVLYLADRVLKAESQASGAGSQEIEESASEAFELIERAHRELHLAETFEDDIINQGFLDWYDEPRIWVLHNYWSIVAVAAALRWYRDPIEKGNSGDDLRTKLKATGTMVDGAFGRLGGEWKKSVEGEKLKKAENDYRRKRETPYWCLPTRHELDRVRRRTREDCLRSLIEEATISGGTMGLRQDDRTRDVKS